MYLVVTIFIDGKRSGDDRELAELWNKENSDFPIENINLFKLKLPKQKEIYFRFKEFFDKHRSKYNIKYKERPEARFSRKDYLKTDKLFMWFRHSVERSQGDLEKSYAIEYCEKCKGMIKYSQHSPLVFSEEVFGEVYDYLDVNLLKKSHMFSTSFGELAVNEKVYQLTVNSNIKGVSFEPVVFQKDKCPAFYQMKIERELGRIINPRLGRSCRVCGTVKTTSRSLDNNFFPFDTCVNLNLDWRIWANKFEAGEFAHYDILRTAESLSWNFHDIRGIIFSPKYREFLISNNIREFYAEPIELVY